MEELQIIFYSVFLGLIFLSIAIYALCQHLDKKKKVEKVELYSFIKTGLSQKVDIGIFLSTIETMSHKQFWNCHQISKAIAEVTCTSMLGKPTKSALFFWIDSSSFAVWYAVNVFASENTRKMACTNPLTAIDYALYVDKMPHHTTRSAACSFNLALDYLGNNPDKLIYCAWNWPPYVSYSDVISGLFAIDYAIKVDKSPSEETREAACRHFVTAMEYAIQVDRGPNEKTRKACCEDANFALEYAIKVDKSAHVDTYRAVCGLTEYRRGFFAGREVMFNEHLVRQYETLLGKPML